MIDRIIISFCTIFFILILIIKRFVYFKPSYNFLEPIEKYIDIYLGNLHGWYKKGTSDKLIIFCHGNGGNISHRQIKLKELFKTGHSILIFDYSGFGHSKGVPTEELCYRNADNFIDFGLKKGYSLKNIYAYGESLGAAVAGYVAVKYNLEKLLIESGLPGVYFLVKNFSFISPLRIFFNDFNTVSFLEKYKGKSLVVHSIEDEIIPYNTTKEMREKATYTINMIGTHNNPDIPWNELRTFLTA